MNCCMVGVVNHESLYGAKRCRVRGGGGRTLIRDAGLGT
jgi:hypothetical protein